MPKRRRPGSATISDFSTPLPVRRPVPSHVNGSMRRVRLVGHRAGRDNGRVDLHACLAHAHHDCSARDQLVNRFYPVVQEMVHRRLRAERRQNKSWMAAMFSTGDVVHDVFMRVLQGVESFDGDEQDFERYLARTVTHRLLDAIRYHAAGRRDGRRASGDVIDRAEELPGDGTSPTSAAARQEEALIVTEALRALTAKDRELLELRQRRGATYREIAEELRLPSPDAARKATCLAEARLLVALRARGVDG